MNDFVSGLIENIALSSEIFKMCRQRCIFQVERWTLKVRFREGGFRWA